MSWASSPAGLPTSERGFFFQLPDASASAHQDTDHDPRRSREHEQQPHARAVSLSHQPGKKLRRISRLPHIRLKYGIRKGGSQQAPHRRQT